jgi:predicted permease
MEVLAIVIPIFAIIVTGAVFAHLKILPEQTGGVLIQFAYYVLVPALLIIAIGQEKSSSLFNVPFLAVLGGGIFGAYALIMLGSTLMQRKRLGEAAIFSTACVASNTGFVALPILHAIFGHKAMLPAALANIVVVILFIITMTLLDNLQSSTGENKKSLSTKILDNLKNPIVFSTLIGIAVAVSPFKFPVIAADYLNLLAAAMTPVALFAIGFLIRLDAFRESGFAILFASLFKLVAMPALIYALAVWLNLSPLLTVAAVVSAAVPTAKTTYIIAGKYKQSPDMVSSIISLTTLLSIPTLIIWLFVLSHLYPKLFAH